MKITVLTRLFEEKHSVEGSGKIELKVPNQFENEDILIFELSEEEMNINSNFVRICIDDYLLPADIYMPTGKLIYYMPTGVKLKAYHENAFNSDEINISIEIIERNILTKRRNIALNSMDLRGETTDYFPHADANVVTRDQPWFEARNAIDGVKDNEGHGQYPYHSWGGGLRDDLEFRVYFGREVIIDEIIIFLRADSHNNHDINWDSGIIELSNGKKIKIEMENTKEGQSFKFEPMKVEWIKLNNLAREKTPEFSALSQIEVYGWDI